MKLVQRASPDLYTWRVYCHNCGALMEVQAKDMVWLRTDQNRRGKPDVFACECMACRQQILVSIDEYKDLPRLVAERIKHPPLPLGPEIQTTKEAG